MLTAAESKALEGITRAVQQGRLPPEVLRLARQTAGERALVRYAAQLAPDHVALAQQIYQQRGWPGLQAALSEAGLMPEAIEIAGHTVASGGFEGLTAAVQTGIQEEIVRETTEAAVARATPQEGDLSAAARTLSKSELAAAIRDPEAQKAAAQWLRERGLTPEMGLSPLEQMVKTSTTLLLPDGDGSLMFQKQRRIGEQKVDQAAHIEEAAKLYREDPKALKSWAEELDHVVTKHGLHKRLAERDARTTTLKPTRETLARERGEARRRSVLEQKADQLEAQETQRRASLPSRPARQAPLTPPGRPSPTAVYERRRSALSEAADRIEIDGPRSGPTPADEVYGKSSLREALEEGFDRLEAESTEAEVGTEAQP